MARAKVDFDTVREMGLKLPDVVDASSARGFALKLGGKLLACKAVHKSAEPETLMVRIAKEPRQQLLDSEPEIYYLTSHYESYPAVLVRLGRIGRRALRALLAEAWRYRMES